MSRSTVLTASTALGHGEAYSSEQLVAECLRVISAREEELGAWTHLDGEAVLDQARQADRRRAAGETEGAPLLGIPVGVKDIFDTRDMPTENGTVVDRGRRPEGDAAVVRRLREAGAIILGKTVTAELAVYTPGKTKNPHDPARTPGGSSSGSAAAVAAAMVPLAVGTQTNGSVIRPASYCGVVGYKPTFGTVPREGVLRQAPSLDQVGVFGRDVRQSALLASVLMGREPCHGDTLPWPALDCARVSEPAEVSSRLGFVRTPVWSEAEEGAREALLQYIAGRGDIIEIELPEICDQALSCHRTIMLCEMAHNYRRYHLEHWQQISPTLLNMLDEGRRIGLDDYQEARILAEKITAAVDTALTGYDAVLTLATPSEAPLGLASTGSPIFCTLWSLCGVPAVSLPLLRGGAGMPLGLQLVAARGCDAELLRTAGRLEESGGIQNPAAQEAGI